MSDFEIERVKGAYRLESFIPGLKKAGRLYKMCCPFHTEQTPSFTVDPNTQQWRCYGACQTGGDILSYVMKSSGLTFHEVLKDLAERAGIRLEKRARKEDALNTRLLSLLKDASHFYHDVLLNSEIAIPAMDYLINVRGLNVGDIETWQIGYAPQMKDASCSHLKKLGYTEQEMITAGVRGQNDEGQTFDRFRHRIMFPICDDKGRIRGFSARAMPGTDDVKYINSPQSELFSKSSLLYGLNRATSGLNATQGAFQVTTIVEGQMDVIRAHKRGFTNVCAQMGTALTDKHLELLKEHGTQTIIFCLDSDTAGQNATHKRARDVITDGSVFRLGMDLKIANLGSFKDPDEMIKTDPALWTEMITQARSAVDVLIDYEVFALPKDASIQQKTDFAKTLMMILRVPNNPMQTIENQRKLAVALSLPESAFVEWSSQIHVLPRMTPAPSVVETQMERPIETAILWGILKNMSDYWLARANAVMDCLTQTPMPYALAPLSALDFSYDMYRHLFEAFVEHEGNLLTHIAGTPLEDVYDRVVNQPEVMGRFMADTPQEQPRDTYPQFIERVIELRMDRLNEDMELFNQMGDMPRFMEAMRGVALIQKKLEVRV